MVKKPALILFLAAFAAAATPQEALKYQLPPAEIVKVVDASVTPIVSVSPDNSKLVIIERPPIITISELSEEELRLAGLRINPATGGTSRQTYNKGFTVINIDGTGAAKINGFPDDPNPGMPEWSPDGSKFAFTNTNKSGIELWVCDLASLRASKIADRLNVVFRNSFTWLSDNRSIVYLVPDPSRGDMPQRSLVPDGPVVQESLGGMGQAATYQDWLLEAPFTGDPQKFIATEMRFNGITWGRDDFAVIYEGLSKTRMRVVSSFNPADPWHCRQQQRNISRAEREAVCCHERTRSSGAPCDAAE